MKTHTVSYDGKSRCWYAHMIGYPYIPVEGSINPDKRVAMDYARMYNGEPNGVAEFERSRKEAFADAFGGAKAEVQD